MVGSAGIHGFSPALTRFIGRVDAVDEVAGLLGDYRLVTVTGPGGVGKTRLAGEVARRVADQFADGVWLVELAAVTDPVRVPSAVKAALGVRERPGVPVAESLAGVLAGWQVLLVLDNCEHVIASVAGLCGVVLRAADDVRILATSREPTGVPGEARYRLAPLGLHKPGPAVEGDSEAVALFADRARLVDRHFTLDGEAGPLAARLVRRLDGIPLAIELAAARVEALGLEQLLDRLDDRLGLLVAGDRQAAARHRSLAATVDWSYQLLGKGEQRVFRQVSVFPAPFTLEAAEAVAGAGAGSAVVRLVECSLLAPPRTGTDGRARYLMMDTMRAYAAGRLAEAGEEPAAAAALAQHTLQVAEQCAAGMRDSAREPDAARWLDADDATVHQALSWALQHSPATALRMAIAVAPWWLMRGRLADGFTLLRAAAAHAEPGSGEWCGAQFWLGQAAYSCGDPAGAAGYFTAVCDAVADREPAPVLVDALAGRALTLVNTNRVTEGIKDARRAVTLARDMGYRAGEALALQAWSMGAYYSGDPADAVALARQAQQVDRADLPGWIARRSSSRLVLALVGSGDVSAARQHCVDALAQARHAADLASHAYCVFYLGWLDLMEGRIAEGWAHLRESTEIANREGEQLAILNCEDLGGHLCAAAQRWAEAVTLWAAYDVHVHAGDWTDPPQDADLRREPLRKARQALGPGPAQAAHERGAAMTMAAAAEFVILLATAEPQAPPGYGRLSARERELVSLIAQGNTDAQIAGQLYISIRTVRSHLDRIRDKTGCRRRADLTRLALQTGLI